MKDLYTPGQTVYLLYWRRPEEQKLSRVSIWLSKKGRDNAMVDYLRWGLIVRPDTWTIPLPNNEKGGNGSGNGEANSRLQIRKESNPAS